MGEFSRFFFFQLKHKFENFNRKVVNHIFFMANKPKFSFLGPRKEEMVYRPRSTWCYFLFCFLENTRKWLLWVVNDPEKKWTLSSHLNVLHMLLLKGFHEREFERRDHHTVPITLNFSPRLQLAKVRRFISFFILRNRILKKEFLLIVKTITS